MTRTALLLLPLLACNGSNPCLDAQGLIAAKYRACAADTDCAVVVVGQCCGTDDARGIKSGTGCTFSAGDCSMLGCPKSIGFTADDMRSATTLSGVSVACTAGVCKSFVDAGSPDGG